MKGLKIKQTYGSSACQDGSHYVVITDESTGNQDQGIQVNGESSENLRFTNKK